MQRFRVARIVDSIVGPAPLAPPRVANDGTALHGNHATATLTWIGHATFLIQLDGVNLLTDPHWSERASPLSFAGPRRVAPAGLGFEDLPRIDVVLISHDHYDHLDLPTVRRLASAIPATGRPCSRRSGDGSARSARPPSPSAPTRPRE